MRDLFLRVVSTEGPYADPVTWCESPRICVESHEKAAGREEFPPNRDVRTGGMIRLNKTTPPERNDIYAGYQYFHICRLNKTLPKNRNRRAKALFPNRNPKTPPAQAAHVMMTIRIGSFITTSDPQGIDLLTGRNHNPTPRP